MSTVEAHAATRGRALPEPIARSGRAVREFLLVPAAVAAGFLGLGVLSMIADKSPPGWLMPLHDTLADLIDKSAASSLLSAIATSVVTVTSITFSVLLLAVQQNASSMTPSVFDQFLRRKTNQIYLGMFVGLSLYAFLVLSSTGPKTTPTFGASLALLLTVAAFLVLIVLIYSTVDQMRPTSVTQVIHDHALRARRREHDILACTHRERRQDWPQRAVVRAPQDGYVTGIDVGRLRRAVDGADAEVVLAVTLGSSVAWGQDLICVHGQSDEECRALAEALQRVIRLDRERDIDFDAGFAIDELSNIAWTSLSTAKQNPSAGRVAIDRLRDIGLRWARAGELQRDAAPLPVVYEDGEYGHLLDALLALVVVCAESHQTESAAHLIAALADVIRESPGPNVDAFEPALVRTLPVAGEHPLTRPLEAALRTMEGTLRSLDRDDAAAQVAELLEPEALSAAYGGALPR